MNMEHCRCKIKQAAKVPISENPNTNLMQYLKIIIFHLVHSAQLLNSKAVNKKNLAKYGYSTVLYDVIRCVVKDAMFALTLLWKPLTSRTFHKYLRSSIIHLELSENFLQKGLICRSKINSVSKHYFVKRVNNNSYSAQNRKM